VVGAFFGFGGPGQLEHDSLAGLDERRFDHGAAQVDSDGVTITHPEFVE